MTADVNKSGFVHPKNSGSKLKVPPELKALKSS